MFIVFARVIKPDTVALHGTCTVAFADASLQSRPPYASTVFSGWQLSEIGLSALSPRIYAITQRADLVRVASHLMWCNGCQLWCLAQLSARLRCCFRRGP